MELFDLHRKRYALISENNKELKIYYGFRLDPLPARLKKKEENYKKRTFSFSKIDAKLVREFDGKLISLTIKCKKANKKLLYQLFLCFVYLVGKRVGLKSFVKDFPYYPVPRSFNFRRSPWSSQIQSLITRPHEILENAFELFTIKDSYFRKLVPILSEINDLSYPDVVFLVEFGVLENLSNKSDKISGIYFQKNSNEYKSLKKFSKDTTGLLNQRSTISIEPIKKKLSVDNLNQKSPIRLRMEEFIASFGTDRISNYRTYVKEWGKLRNKGLAHGGFGNTNSLKNNLKNMNKLHALLVDIVDYEFRGKLKINNNG